MVTVQAIGLLFKLPGSALSAGGQNSPLLAPPSTLTAVPVMKLAGSEHRKATTRPKSSGSPMRPGLPVSLTRSVAWLPGQAVLRVMPSSTRSAAAVLAQAHSPVRDRLDRERTGIGSLTAMEVIRQIRPHPARRIHGTAARTRRTEVTRLALTAAGDLVVGHLQRPLERWAAGVGHEDVEAPEMGGHGVDQPGRLVRGGHVGDQGQDLAALLEDQPLGRPELLLTPGADPDLDPFGRQRQGASPAETLGRGRHQGHLAGNTEIHPAQPSTIARLWSTALSDRGPSSPATTMSSMRAP